jgi:hypothetical protein
VDRDIEERIADQVVAKLEPLLRLLLAEALQRFAPPDTSLRPDAPPPQRDDLTDDQVRYQARARSATFHKGIAVQRPAPPLKRPSVLLACGHVVAAGGRGEWKLSDEELIAVERHCRECSETFHELHPAPPRPPEQQARADRRRDEMLETVERKVRRPSPPRRK